jgi:nucleotide-binding universal stress UspA family protein
MILVPTDFSRDSNYALEIASFLARERGARLILLHVVPSTDPALAVRAEGSGERVRAEHAAEDLGSYRKEMEEKLQQVRLPYPDGSAVRVVKEGDVTRAILQAISEFGPDLVVMGTRGQGGNNHRPLGPVTEVVSRESNGPVLTVHDPWI